MKDLRPFNASVKNPDGYWINTELFKTEATHFKKYGYYTPDPWGTPAWLEYWKQQLEYCKKGFSVGGVKITGHHYNYLNFAPIALISLEDQGSDKRYAKKEQDFPHFWDGDYNYFWVKDIARYGMELQRYQELGLHITILPDHLNGGWHVIVGKARRKGYSFKNAAILANTYNTTPKSISLVGAFESKYLYPKGTMSMATDYLNFYNAHTGWKKKREVNNSQDHRKASFIETDEGGFQTEKGYQSEIIAVSYKDNPDAARGKDATEVFLEEAGKFPNLIAAFMATDDTVRAGRYLSGQITIFGTSGDMERGSVDFANMFYNAEGYGCLPIVNVWDDNADNTQCGYFHPVTMNWEGFYDKDGNSDVEKALAYELNKRDTLIKKANSITALQRRMMENPIKPAEAFLNISLNNFPIADLRQQLNKVKSEGLHTKLGQVGWFTLENGKPVFHPDLKNELQAIYNFPNKEADLTGAVIIYEAPVPNAPKGLYKIGYDPYRQNLAADSVSFGACYVYKTVLRGNQTKHIIVAEYVGRPQNMDIYNRNIMMLAMFYNTEVMYENEVTAVMTYFEKMKRLHLLAAQPDNLISNIIKISKVKRVFGMHMTDKIKEAGEKYINTWLLTERDIDEDGNVILNLHTINSRGLLEELISYNRKGNFDRVMAFMMVMFQIEADTADYEAEKTKSKVAEQLEELILFSRK